jgi:cephalosporin hydroxylase
MSMFQNISETLFKPHGYTGVDWAMTFAEKFAMVGILERLRPKVALEIGTLNGGSLSVISKYSGRVLSIDPDPNIRQRLENQFCNVEFITEASQTALPRLIEGFNTNRDELGFVLIDGDHTEEGVRQDIQAVLKYRPVSALWILMHDSFNPDCRRAMKSIDWENNPHVHWINYDFIPGFLSNLPGWEDQMWCGFALAYLEARPREGKLAYGELLGRQFEKLLPVSDHGKMAL